MRSSSLIVTLLLSSVLFAGAAAFCQELAPVSAINSPVKERDITESASPANLSEDSVSAEPSEESFSDDLVMTSPKRGWHDFPEEDDGSAEAQPWWECALLWLPNRLLDFIDIFRIDAGVGPGLGAVVRITRYGQVGYREMRPWSLRIGDFGRRSPFLLERSDESGFGPWYDNSRDRRVGEYELGAGADILIGGAYIGFRLDEAWDFLAGLAAFDPGNDDLQF